MKYLATIVIMMTEIVMKTMGGEVELSFKGHPCRIGVLYSPEGKCVWHREEIPGAIMNREQHTLRCVEEGKGELVSILTASKQQFIETMVLLGINTDEVSAFVGLRANLERELEWSNGQTMEYSNIAGGGMGIQVEPMLSCGVMDGSTQWVISSCDDEMLGRICEAPVCTADKCQHVCVEESDPICQCYPGFKIENGTDCKAIDLCTNKTGGCEHKMCETENGTTKVCSCRDGFKVDGDKCEEILDSEGKKDKKSGNTFLIIAIVLAVIGGAAVLMFVASNKSKKNDAAAPEKQQTDEVEPKEDNESGGENEEEEGAEEEGKKKSVFHEEEGGEMGGHEEEEGGD